MRQVGVIVPSISSQSVGQITSGIAAELGASRYLMLLADTELDGQMELEYLTALQRNHVPVSSCWAMIQPAAVQGAERLPCACGGNRAALCRPALRL